MRVWIVSRDLRSSLETCFAEAVQIMLHCVRSEGQIFVYPSERHVWLHLLEPLQCCTRLIYPTRLSQAGTQLTMGTEVLGSLLSDIVGVVGGFAIASPLIKGWPTPIMKTIFCGSCGLKLRA